jgi:hypothetical protein
MNLACKMVMGAAIRCAQMVGSAAPTSWGRIRDTLVLPIDKTNGIVLPYDNPPSSSNSAYSLGQIDFLAVHDAAISLELLRKTHDFEETVRQARAKAAHMDSADFSIGFATAAISATAAFLGDKRRAAELFGQSWRNAWLEPFGMIREAPSQDYGCFLTNLGSLLQTAMFGFTGLRVNEGHWAKFPASLPAGWARIDIDRVFVKGEAKRLVAIDSSPAKLLSS